MILITHHALLTLLTCEYDEPDCTLVSGVLPWTILLAWIPSGCTNGPEQVGKLAVGRLDFLTICQNKGTERGTAVIKIDYTTRLLIMAYNMHNGLCA